MLRAAGDGTVRTVRIGSATTNTVADGAELSTGDVQFRVSNGCFGVSMIGCWMNADPEVNRLKTPYCVRTCQVVSGRVRAFGRRRQRRVRTPRRDFRGTRLGLPSGLRGSAKMAKS